MPAVFLGGEIHRHLTEDRREPVGLSGARLPGGELLAHAVFDVKCWELLIDLVDAVIALDQIHRGLLADPGDAGNVVGAVAHQGLQVDDAARLEAVLGTKDLGCIEDRLGPAHAALYMADRGCFADQLQTVLVAGDDRAVPA